MESRADRSSRGAFTLVEMMIVVAVLVILAGFVPFMIPRHLSQEARPSAAKLQIATLGTALGEYKLNNGAFPAGRDGLQALWQKPPDAADWRGPYMEKEIPLDPWGRHYVYEFPGRHNTNAYDLYTIGPDGTVYGNWTEKQK